MERQAILCWVDLGVFESTSISLYFLATSYNHKVEVLDRVNLENNI